MNKIELNRDVKILLLQVLKNNEITDVQANSFVDFLVENKLIERIQIQFVDFSQKKE